MKVNGVGSAEKGCGRMISKGMGVPYDSICCSICYCLRNHWYKKATSCIDKKLDLQTHGYGSWRNDPHCERQRL